MELKKNDQIFMPLQKEILEDNVDNIENSQIHAHLDLDVDQLEIGKKIIDILQDIDEERTQKEKQENVSHEKPDDCESFMELNVNNIKSNPMQPRLHIDESELNDLMRSIRQHGLIQPISVVQTGYDDFILQTGQRRLIAHKELGLKTIKAIVHESNKDVEKSLFEIAVIENIQRENLNPLELALSLREAMNKNLYKNLDELGNVLGKSKSYISKALKVLLLDDDVIKDLEENKSTNDIESLYEIQKIKDKKEQVEVYFDFIAKKIDRKGIRELNSIKNEVSHAKPRYYFTNRSKTIKLEFEITDYTDEVVGNLKLELEEILKKYYLRYFNSMQ